MMDSLTSAPAIARYAAFLCALVSWTTLVSKKYTCALCSWTYHDLGAFCTLFGQKEWKDVASLLVAGVMACLLIPVDLPSASSSPTR